MNRIDFRVVTAMERDRKLPVAAIVIDGIDFRERVEAAEEQFAIAEGTPSIAGKYRGLWLKYVAPPSRHFLGEPSHPVYREGEKTQILECESGEPGCWPLLCRIDLTEDTVRWSQFEQPHRSGQSGKPGWDYSQLGPFEFERSKYEAALARLGSTPDS